MTDGPLFRSQLIIRVVNNDGTELEGPMNQLIDECYNLTDEQAKAHHYALKKVYGELLASIDQESLSKMRTAAGA